MGAAAADEERVSPKPARNLALGLLLGRLSASRSCSSASSGTSVRHDPPGQMLRPAEPLTGRFRLPRPGRWTVSDVERLLVEQGDAFPERREELEVYLDSFRSVADADGRLPGDLELVIEEVFGPLIERAR